jgi:type VI secretion system protein
MAHGFLKRFREGGRASVRIEDEILDHLRALFNSRQGLAETAPSFGVVDFCDVVHSLPQGLRHIERAIETSVERFEPRLVEVQVRCVPEEGALRLRFEIVGRLRHDPHKVLRARTSLGVGGRFEVEAA